MTSNPTPDPRPQPDPSTAPRTDFAAQRRAARPWFLQPETAIWLGPVLIVVCLALRFGWGGLEGPPFPFWGLAYIIGAAGIFLTYQGVLERHDRR
jgi:hypothetical protein